uniref:Uncharacterized protein n=1 Tax=Pseudoalteromonas luteoviolacea TaxID=43657 RepID=A0A023PZ60_9GAMM|nr:hypothetical protein [Pseudoalteromonas luteoviolacea]
MTSVKKGFTVKPFLCVLKCYLSAQLNKASTPATICTVKVAVATDYKGPLIIKNIFYAGRELKFRLLYFCW